MKKTLLQLILTLCVMMAGVSGYLKFSSFWLPFEYKIKDLMFKVRGKIPGNDAIIIIDIDEKSLKELGQWPWSRDTIASLLQQLSDLGVGIVGLDVVFAEADNSSPKRVFEKLGLPHEDVVDYDALFAQAVGQTPTLVGYVFAMTPDGIAPEKHPKSKAIIVEKNKPTHSYLLKPYRTILNIPSIQEAAYSSAYFNTLPDSDGIVRSIPMVMEYEGVLYPSLSLEMMRIVLDEKKIEVVYDEEGVSYIQLGETLIPTDFNGRMLINFRGPQHSYRYISASDIYFKRVSPSEIEGKIALLGTSAAGLLDLRSTPFESVYAGVEVHANAIDNILSQTFLSKPIWVVGVDVLSVLVVCLLTLLGLLFSSALISFLALVFLNTLLVGLHYHWMNAEGLIFNTITPLLCINVLFVMGQAVNYFLEIKQKELIKGKFASKVSPAVMNDILSSSSNIFEGKEREITVFFSDVRNFTNISEAMGDPKKLIRLMNAYMDPMTDIIIKNKGTVDKFIGDAIMAYWNAPVDVEGHADKAVRAALEQLYRLKSLNDTLRQTPEFENVTLMADKKGVAIIDIGIGINTGIAIVGEMGSSGRSDYTVIGDPINLGSRLESLCKYYNSKLNISHFTKAKLQGAYIVRFLDLVTVKGKREPVEIWQVHDFADKDTVTLDGVSKALLVEELAYHHDAIGLYQRGLFAEALHAFETLDALETKTNRAIYGIYCERCRHYLEHPPHSFNGVFEHTSKG